MDLDRTNAMLENTMDRTDFFSKSKIDDDKEIKKATLVAKMANIHINTAKTKLGAIRILGYKDNLNKMKGSLHLSPQCDALDARKMGTVVHEATASPKTMKMLSDGTTFATDSFQRKGAKVQRREVQGALLRRDPAPKALNFAPSRPCDFASEKYP